MQSTSRCKLFSVIFLIICFVGVLFNSPQCAVANTAARAKIKGMKRNIEFKRTQTRKKIKELKERENDEISKLSTSEAQLENTKGQIQVYQQRLDVSKAKLFHLQAQVSVYAREQDVVAKKAGGRIKQIYEGERIGILHLIFASKDINSFLDRVYYQKRLAVYDKSLLKQLRLKTIKYENAKSSLIAEQGNIIKTINDMHAQKRQIANDISLSHRLIDKLRNNRATYEAGERDLARQSANLESLLSRQFSAIGAKTVAVKGAFARPLSGIITSPFGWRKHPIFGSKSFHTGVDIAAPYSSTIRAANSGRVVYTGWYGGYGKVVIINHGRYKGSAASTLYAHLSRTSVSAGQQITQGQVIGYEGTTGYSTGPHLHFEVRMNGKPTNPLNYIP